MFRLIKQLFYCIITFCGSLATKRLSLNNEPCMPTLIDLNPVHNKTI